MFLAPQSSWHVICVISHLRRYGTLRWRHGGRHKREIADWICLSSWFDPLVRTPVWLYGLFPSTHRKQILWQKAILLSIQCAVATVYNENIAHVKPRKVSTSWGHGDWGSILGSEREFSLPMTPLQTSCVGTLCILPSGYYGVRFQADAENIFCSIKSAVSGVSPLAYTVDTRQSVCWKTCF
jgi:hypothetical protein